MAYDDMYEITSDYLYYYRLPITFSIYYRLLLQSVTITSLESGQWSVLMSHCSTARLNMMLLILLLIINLSSN